MREVLARGFRRSLISGIGVEAGQSVTFRVFDKGENGFDHGVFDFTVTLIPEPSSVVRLVLGSIVFFRRKHLGQAGLESLPGLVLSTNKARATH